MVQRNDPLEVTERDFEERVIARSSTVPMVVDFWAPWCGPCRVIGPVLERLAGAADGAWELVKVDTDAQPGLGRRFGIQSIPAVKAFRDGQVVAEFVGAQPEPRIRQFLKGLAPSPADGLVRQGRAALDAGDTDAGELALLQALTAQPNHPGALLGLAELALGRGSAAEAERLLEGIPQGSAEGKAAAPLQARIRFLQQAGNGARPDEARAMLAADERDAGAHLALGVHAAAGGDYGQALASLLRTVEVDRKGVGETARKAMIDIFIMLGVDDPLAREYRSRLAASLH